MCQERFVTGELGRVAESYEGWRCLLCGEIVDPVIVSNRRLSAAPAGVEPVRAGHEAA